MKCRLNLLFYNTYNSLFYIGYGRLHTTGGRYIEANFDKGGATGNVKIIYPDDMVLECIYKNHKIIEGSKGKITWKDGRQFEGL